MRFNFGKPPLSDHHVMIYRAEERISDFSGLYADDLNGDGSKFPALVQKCRKRENQIPTLFPLGKHTVQKNWFFILKIKFIQSQLLRQ
jgi:hypothetical protein